MMKSLKNLLDKGDLKPHTPTKSEIDGIRKLVRRDLKDADIQELSIDRRFATAYNAALNLSRIVVISEGYRITAKIGHHKVSFSCASKILGKQYEDFFSLFELCRRKRNKVDYDQSDVATETELLELLEKSHEFKTCIDKWLTTHYSNLIT